MQSRGRGMRTITATVGLICLAVLSSIIFTVVALFLVKKTIKIEILLTVAVISSMVALLLSFIFFKLFTLREDREMQAQQLASKDFLNQVLNSRLLLQQVKKALLQAKHCGTTFSLLLLEIDNFKDINVTYGRSASERVLQALTQACLEIIRSSDVVARRNEREFIVFLSETGAEEALIIAHRIRYALSEVPVVISNALINFTVSIGVAAYDKETATLDSLLRRAGRALLNARQQGCNRVEVG